MAVALIIAVIKLAIDVESCERRLDSEIEALASEEAKA